MTDRARACQRDLLIYGAPLAAVGLATLFILNPGILSPDSLDQWNQARGLSHLHDWHPVLDTLWIRLWSFANTPAVPIAVQTLAMAGVVGFGCHVQRSAAIPAWVVAPAAVLVAVWPPTVAFDATLWKDVPYSVAVLAATALLYQLWQSPVAATRRSFRIALAVSVFGTAMFRHNGVAAALCIIVAALLLAQADRRRILIATVIAVGCWAGLDKLVKKVAGVTPIPPGYVAVGYLASHVAAGTPLEPEEARLVDAMHPLAGGWPYVCGLTDPTVYDGKFHSEPLIQAGWTPLVLVAKLTLRQPWATYRHFVCASRFLWDPVTDRLTGPAIWADATGFRTVPDSTSVVARSPVPRLRNWLLELLLQTLRPGPLQVFWSPALALYVLLLAAGWVALRNRQWAPLVVFLPLVGQTLIMLLIAPTPHVRYQFAVIMAAWVFAPGLCYLELRRDRGTAGAAG